VAGDKIYNMEIDNNNDINANYKINNYELYQIVKDNNLQSNLNNTITSKFEHRPFEKENDDISRSRLNIDDFLDNDKSNIDKTNYHTPSK